MDPSDLVEPRLGTTQTRWIAFSSACRPFGMVNVSPDTRINGDWGCGYRYGDGRTVGISHIHEWQIGALLTMPVVGTVHLARGPDEWASPFSHDTEVVKPGYHRLWLDRHGIETELTATSRVAVHRYRFPHATDRRWVIDLKSTLGPSDMGESALFHDGHQRLAGYVDNLPTVRRPKPLRVYFEIECSVPLHVETSDEGRHVCKLADGEEPVVFKVGLSYTSIAAARENLRAETSGLTFDQIREEARTEWNAMLGRFEVTGDADRRARFYTDLYFALLGRRTVSDVSGTYIDNTGDSPVVRQIPLDADQRPKYRHFNSDSFWGAQWSITPLWSLAYPEIVGEFCQCFFDYYRNGGLIPRGPAGGNYTFVMTSAQTTPLFVHAVLAGIDGIHDPHAVFVALKKNHLPGGLMSKCGYEHHTALGGGLADYLERGYIPEDLPKVGFHNNGAAQTLEHAFNDHALAVLAKNLGLTDDAKTFETRSHNYLNLFDRSIGFMRPRNRDGSWLDPYSPWDKRGWTEANGWNYTFYSAHDVPGLINCFGGREAFLAKLEEAFAIDETLGFKAPHDQHEQAPLDFGNEPPLATAHLFHAAGQPERTDYWLRRIYATLKSGNKPTDGYGGDEDQGMMGAWNVLVAIGLFTLTGGCDDEPHYLVTAPLFERIVIHRPGVEPLTITADTAVAKNGPAGGVTIDGIPSTARRLPYVRVREGGASVHVSA